MAVSCYRVAYLGAFATNQTMTKMESKMESLLLALVAVLVYMGYKAFTL